jgi:uncharacterized protein YndB with AHSA1/START domain
VVAGDLAGAGLARQDFAVGSTSSAPGHAEFGTGEAMTGHSAAGRQVLPVEEYLPYRADRVWHVLTTADQVPRWLGVNGFRLEPGCRIPIQSDPVRRVGLGGTGQFEVIAFEEARMLRVAWRAARAEERGLGSAVTFTLTAEGAGTLLFIEHDGRYPCGFSIGTSRRGHPPARSVGEVPKTVSAWRACISRIGDLLAAARDLLELTI